MLKNISTEKMLLILETDIRTSGGLMYVFKWTIKDVILIFMSTILFSIN